MPYESIPAVSDGSLKKDHPDETRPDQRLHRPATNCSRVRGGGRIVKVEILIPK